MVEELVKERIMARDIINEKSVPTQNEEKTSFIKMGIIITLFASYLIYILCFLH